MSEHTHGKLKFKMEVKELKKQNKEADEEIDKLKRRIDNIRRIRKHLKPTMVV